jgi:hypothetical protein
MRKVSSHLFTFWKIRFFTSIEGSGHNKLARNSRESLEVIFYIIRVQKFLQISSILESKILKWKSRSPLFLNVVGRTLVPSLNSLIVNDIIEIEWN